MPQNYFSRRLTRRLRGSEICVVMVMEEEAQQDEIASSQEASGQMGYERLGRPGKDRKRWGFSLPHCCPPRDWASLLCHSALQPDARRPPRVQMQNREAQQGVGRRFCIPNNH